MATILSLPVWMYGTVPDMSGKSLPGVFIAASRDKYRLRQMASIKIKIR
jgi:hypothetical protein